MIVHRNPSREVRGQPPKKRSKVPAHFVVAFGSVVHEDDWLFVFDLKSNSASVAGGTCIASLDSAYDVGPY